MRVASRHVTAATSATLFLTIALLAGPARAAEPEGPRTTI